MSRAAGDPYLDPVSGVLRNLLGITDAAELARVLADVNALHPFREGNGRPAGVLLPAHP